MTRLRLLVALAALVLAPALRADEPAVRITLRPQSLVHGSLAVPVTVAPSVTRVELSVNGVPFDQKSGRSMVFTIPIGEYIRRLRVRATGYDAYNSVVGEDEMVVNDPQPPFRVRLSAPAKLPSGGLVAVDAIVTAPANLPIEKVDFFVGEEKAGVAARPPYSMQFDLKFYEHPMYVRAVAHAGGGLEANDIFFWGDMPQYRVDVALHQIPVSIAGQNRQTIPALADLTLQDNGEARKIESVIPAADQPLNVIMLIDDSESMLAELPVIKQAAKEFAHSLIRSNDRIALVAFHERTFWLTPFTSDMSLVDAAVEKLRPHGETHLYDSVIEMLYEIQKMPGRHAVIVLTDGVNQGGDFKLDHLVHYARYSGVPVYPVIKNVMLSRMMKLGIGRLEARRFAEVARDTGASYFIIQKPAELPAVYARISDELKNQFLITFYSESTGKDEWHLVTLRSRDGVQFRMPRGYFP